MKKSVVIGLVFAALLLTGCLGRNVSSFSEACFVPVDYSPDFAELEWASEILDVYAGLYFSEYTITVDFDDPTVCVRVPIKDKASAVSENFWQSMAVPAQVTFKDADGNILLSGSHVKRAKAVGYTTQGTEAYQAENGRVYMVQFMLDEEGEKLFSDATKELAFSEIGIYLDDTLVSFLLAFDGSPAGDVFLSKPLAREDAEKIACRVNLGLLPFQMVLSATVNAISPPA